MPVQQKTKMNACIKPKWIEIKVKPEKIGDSRYPVENYYNKKWKLVPCGKCELCRARYAAKWAKRCELETLEAPTKNNYFLTLTFAKMPLITKKKQMISYCKKLTQDFIKKIRNAQRKIELKLKYVMVWELGKLKMRLHAHALIWGLELNDIVPYGMSDRGLPLYLSEKLNHYWEHGLAWIGQLTPESAAYCFKYSAKNFIAKFQSQGIGLSFYKKNKKEVLMEEQYQNKFFFRHHRKEIGEDAYLREIKYNEKNKKKLDDRKINLFYEQCKELNKAREKLRKPR